MFLLSGPKKVFRPARATRCSDKSEIWHEGANRWFAPRAKFHVYWGQKCGNTAPKTVKISILAINLPFRGDSFAVFSRNSQRLYASIARF